MKTFLLLAICLALSGCDRHQENQREVIGKLDAIQAELSKATAPVRWATAKRNEINTAIYVWSREKLEQLKKSENLSPEIQAQITEYEKLKAELQQKEIGLRTIPTRTLRLAPGVDPALTPPANPEIEALSKKVAQAKAPVASIVDRWERKAAEFRQEFTIDQLVAEYAKGRFDLVVDSSYESRFSPTVLYRTGGEVTDITQGVLALFNEKTK